MAVKVCAVAWWMERKRSLLSLILLQSLNPAHPFYKQFISLRPTAPFRPTMIRVVGSKQPPEPSRTPCKGPPPGGLLPIARARLYSIFHPTRRP